MSETGKRPRLSDVELLNGQHDVSEFDCLRHPVLNQWLRKRALANQITGDSRTFVVHRDKKIVGYYALAPGSVARAEAVSRLRRNAPDTVAIILLARLAVHGAEQGSGLGAALLKDAFVRVVSAADIIEGRAMLVHAIDEDAAGFYRRYGFEACPGLPLHLMMPLGDIRKSLGIN